MKSLSQHITESFVNEDVISQARQLFNDATKMRPGDKIRAIAKVEKMVSDYAETLSDKELIQSQIKTNQPLEQKVFSSLLHSRAQDKLNSVANKNRQGNTGKVNTVQQAIEILTESFVNETVKSMVDQLAEIKDSKKKLKFLDKLSDTHIQALFQELYPKENPNQSIKEKMEKLAGL